MDKASIIKDAIEYIEHLQAEERQVLQEVRAVEAATGAEHKYDEGVILQAERKKKMKRVQSVPSFMAAAAPPPVEVLELRVSEVGDRVLVVSVTCSKRRDAMARVCRAIEELSLRVITANITSVAGCLMHTVFIEVLFLIWVIIQYFRVHSDQIALFLDDMVVMTSWTVAAFVGLTSRKTLTFTMTHTALAL